MKLDTTKIAVSGHSFGGVTSVLTAHEDPRISACLSIDPWFFPILKNLDSIKLAKPLLMVNSAKFSRICNSFDVWKSLHSFFSQSPSQHKSGVIVKDLDHIQQFDMPILVPLELFLSEGVWPSLNAPYKYFMHAQFMLEFLDRIGYNHESLFDPTDVKRRITEFTSEYS